MLKKAKLKRVKAVVFDFDGVFTNNKVIVSEEGCESVICDRSDGMGLELLRKMNIPMKIISSEKNPVVLKRALKLKLPVVHNVEYKLDKLKKFSAELGFGLESFAYVGNDLNDKECMENVGIPVSVQDAVKEIKQISSIVLKRKGGYGAVREFCELVFNAKKK